MSADERTAIARSWATDLAEWHDHHGEEGPEDWDIVPISFTGLLRWNLPVEIDPLCVLPDERGMPTLVGLGTETLIVARLAGFFQRREPLVEFRTIPIAQAVARLSATVRRGFQSNAPFRETAWELTVDGVRTLAWRTSEFAWNNDSPQERLGRAIGARLGWTFPDIDPQIEKSRF
jgi:hypothetical protein